MIKITMIKITITFPPETFAYLLRSKIHFKWETRNENSLLKTNV